MDPSLHETEAGNILVTEEGAESHGDVSEVTQVVSGRQHHLYPGPADPGGQDFNRHVIFSFSLTGIPLPPVNSDKKDCVQIKCLLGEKETTDFELRTSASHAFSSFALSDTSPGKKYYTHSAGEGN